MIALLVPACVFHEQGDLDAVVDVELVEQAGDVGLDRRDGEVQSCGDLGVGVAAADGEGDVVLAWAERGHAVAGVVGAGGRVGVAGDEGDEPSRYVVRAGRGGVGLPPSLTFRSRLWPSRDTVSVASDPASAFRT